MAWIARNKLSFVILLSEILTLLLPTASIAERSCYSCGLRKWCEEKLESKKCADNEVCWQLVDRNNEWKLLGCKAMPKDKPDGCSVMNENKDGKIQECYCNEDNCNGKNMVTGKSIQ